VRRVYTNSVLVKCCRILNRKRRTRIFLVINLDYNFKRYFLVSSIIVMKPENMSLIRQPPFNNHKTVPSNLNDTTEIMLGRQTGAREFLFYFRINISIKYLYLSGHNREIKYDLFL